ncbi:alpha/beta hydrolase [Roseovarius sp. LXJ103]|nr:alpha/beta hydrolase [Roseovarius carneus]PWE37355.1 alpha/beta hydrolase [Pelagicola sp. LXJ1103]
MGKLNLSSPVPAVLAALLIAASLWVLQGARAGVEITGGAVGATPVTTFAKPGADGPHVVVAHGFAGSRQMMQGYALPLARSGYRVHVFDFLGHGRHTLPMSGDVSVIEGTTRRLMDQTSAVIDAVADPGVPVALMGHSMATDVLVRVAAERDDIGPMVLISAFSQAIDAQHPRQLLLVTGAWEAGLRGYAVEAAQMVAADTQEGGLAVNGDVERRAVAAPWAEHVAVLHSRAGRAAAVEWLDAAYDRESAPRIWHTGWGILGLLAGLVLLFGPMAKRLPQTAPPHTQRLTRTRLAVASLLPALAAPLLAVPLNPNLLPVLVADYLALHLAIFGIIQLVLLRRWGVPLGGLSLAGFALLLLWCAAFGFAMDRYAANFWPVGQRVWIIAAIAIGAVPYMLADAALMRGAPVLHRLATRGGFIASLGLAVALDFSGLFFLLMIAPVIVLFYLTFGTMGRQAAARIGPLAPGLALGLVLAWALGVSFPLFQS